MRRNHVNDKDLLDKIERRLADGEPTGFEIVDDLADTVPRADPRFRDELEARLMIRFQSREEVAEKERDEKPMITTIAQPKRLPRPVFRPSLTLLAALLVMVVVGAALLMLNNGSRPDGNLGAGVLSQDSTDTPSPTNTFTPTPVPIMSEVPEEIPPAPVTTEMMTYVPTAYLTDTPTASPFMVSPTMIPENQSVEAEGGPLTATYIPAGAVAVPPSTLRLVVLAARDLPQGTEITQSDVILTYWPADTAPVGTFDGLVNLVPRYTTRDILRWQPIFEVDLK